MERRNNMWHSCKDEPPKNNRKIIVKYGSNGVNIARYDKQQDLYYTEGLYEKRIVIMNPTVWSEIE